MISVEAHREVAPAHLHRDIRGFFHISEPRGDRRRCAGSRAAGESFAVSAFPDAHFQRGLIDDADEFDIRPFGEKRRVLNERAESADIGAIRSVREDHRVRISHRYAAYPYALAADLCVTFENFLSVERHRKRFRRKIGASHINRYRGCFSGRDIKLQRFHSGIRFDGQIFAFRAAAVVQEFSDAAHRVARHPSERAVAVVYLH